MATMTVKKTEKKPANNKNLQAVSQMNLRLVNERHETVFLKQEEFDFFLNVLDNAENIEPSSRSRAAAERYRTHR